MTSLMVTSTTWVKIHNQHPSVASAKGVEKLPSGGRLAKKGKPDAMRRIETRRGRRAGEIQNSKNETLVMMDTKTLSPLHLHPD